MAQKLGAGEQKIGTKKRSDSKPTGRQPAKGSPVKNQRNPQRSPHGKTRAGRSPQRNQENQIRKDPEKKIRQQSQQTAGRKRVGKGRKKMNDKWFHVGAGLDLPLLFLIVILLSIGLIMLFSASYAHSLRFYNNVYHFIQSQATFAVVGLLIMYGVSLLDYHHYHRFAWPLYAFTGVMLAITVLFRDTALAPVKGGTASRWLNLGFVEFQPSEIGKFALILVFAHMISQRAEKMDNFRLGFLPFMGVLGLYDILIVLERHLSATIIITMIAVMLMIVGGTKLRYLLTVGGVGIAAGLSVVLLSDSFHYATERISGWLDPFGGSVDTYQTRQSLYAIGSGQLLGVGLGQSRQKHLYLPEPQNDFIFAIVCEELGFIGALFILVLFALLIWRGVYVSLHAKDRFGMMIGLGITFQVGLQIILNIAVVTNTIPNTGIGLPFFSSGGTALLILLTEMGVLLQISRSSNIEKT